MRLAEWLTLVDTEHFEKTEEFELIRGNLEAAIAAVRWPVGSRDFCINPVKKGNGVKPIKEAFISVLEDEGWTPEFETFDAHLRLSSGSGAFVAEWETGNISSSHRAINRIALGNIEGRIRGGVLVVPTKKLYPYLTDRVGNAGELLPYHELWKKWNALTGFGYFGIISVEHDRLSDDVSLIAKGTDGRALV